MRTLALFFLMVLPALAQAQIVQVHVGATTSGQATFVLDEGLAKDPRYNSTYTYTFAPI